MFDLLSLKPEDECRIHPYALKRYYEWRLKILREIPQLAMLETTIVNEDLNTFLKDNEKVEAVKFDADIKKWLFSCFDIGIGNSPEPYSSWVFDSMAGLKKLLRTVYERKEEKAKAEQKKKDYEEKWHAAYIIVNPPVDDAERYLNLPGEYDEFLQFAGKAIEIYMKKGKTYLSDVRTLKYTLCLNKIIKRKEEESQKAAAELEAREFNQRLSKEKVRLKALLCPNKKDLKDYFKKEINDPRYEGESFTHFLSREKEVIFNNIIVNIANKRFNTLISNDYLQFIDVKFYGDFFLLPRASYSFKGLPCLDFIFDVFAVVEIRIWLKPGQKTFGSDSFALPWLRGDGYSFLLRKPEFLGYDYMLLTPKDFGTSVFLQSIPLILIKSLMDGETHPVGIKILAASQSEKTYKINKFQEEVTIPRSLEIYLKKIGSVERMVSMGIINREIANIIPETNSQSVSETKTLHFKDKAPRNDTIKAKLFALYNEGKRPGSSEIKSQGIKETTAYRYHQDWKRKYVTENDRN